MAETIGKPSKQRKKTLFLKRNIILWRKEGCCKRLFWIKVPWRKVRVQSDDAFSLTELLGSGVLLRGVIHIFSWRCYVYFFLLETINDESLLMILLGSIIGISSCNWCGFVLHESSPFWPPSFILESVSSVSHVRLFATPWTARQASLSITNSWSLLKFMSIELVMPSNHLILCCPLLLPPSIFSASGSFPVSQLFASGGQSIGVSAFSISPSNEYSELLSFRMNRLELFEVQGTLKSLLQHHSSKASILRHSDFFIFHINSMLIFILGYTISWKASHSHLY